MSTSKTGKHGHAKVHMVALDIFGKFKYGQWASQIKILRFYVLEKWFLGKFWERFYDDVITFLWLNEDVIIDV